MNVSAFHRYLGHALLLEPTHNVTLPTISRLQEKHTDCDDSPNKEKLLVHLQSISGTSGNGHTRELGLGGRGLGDLSNVDDILLGWCCCSDIEFVARNGRFSSSVQILKKGHNYQQLSNLRGRPNSKECVLMSRVPREYLPLAPRALRSWRS